MTDWDEIRTHFPALQDRVYLNTAGGGPICREAAERVHQYYDEFCREGDTTWNACLDRVEHTRQKLAGLLGVFSEEIAFLANASQGLNLVADLLAGDGRVVALSDDFPSVTLPWLGRGRDVEFLESPDQLDDALRASPAVLAVSLVQYKTGFRLDLDRVSALCQEHGTALVLDATQAFGVISIDLERIPVDALVFSAYKWATAGYGIAPLVVRRSLLEERGLPSVGWRSAREPYDLESTKLDLTTEARGLELGHPPFAGVFALAGALELIQSIGLAAIEARVAHLLDELHRGLEARGIPIDSPREPSARSPITMIRVPDPPATAAALAERNVFVSARGEGLRVSVHYYNNEDDLETFFDVLTSYCSPRSANVTR